MKNYLIKPLHPNHEYSENVRLRLLVISDNSELSLHLKSTLKKYKFDSFLTVDFCYTCFNKHPEKMIMLGAQEINIQDEGTVENVLQEYNIVFSLHCKQIFPERLVENVFCVNFHPGLNPFNRGWYPQAFSILNDLPIGATIHLMDADIDHGEIIAQKKVCIEESDTSLELYRKVVEAEKSLITDNISNIMLGNFQTIAPTDEGNYNSINSYRSICELDLTSIGTLKDHIKLLRATSHGNFKNAYFTDVVGSKYYVKIVIEKEE
jgi:hypothetical protein